MVKCVHINTQNGPNHLGSALVRVKALGPAKVKALETRGVTFPASVAPLLRGSKEMNAAPKRCMQGRTDRVALSL